MDRRKGFDLYHTEIVIIRKEVCPTSKFENIDQVTFKGNFAGIKFRGFHGFRKNREIKSWRKICN